MKLNRPDVVRVSGFYIVPIFHIFFICLPAGNETKGAGVEISVKGRILIHNAAGEV
jgi:hypothetical protein